METKNFTINYWYSARYGSGFSIIFQVLEIDKDGMALLRKDGTIVYSIPDGYIEIIPHGLTEPEY